LDVDVEILENADDAGRVRRVAVARDRHEVDLARDREAAHEVGHEEHGALEDPDEQEVPSRIVGRDLFADLRDAALQRVLVDQDLGDRALELGGAHARTASTSGCSTTPATATPSSPRTTSGQASRSDLGTFASTNTS